MLAEAIVKAETVAAIRRKEAGGMSSTTTTTRSATSGPRQTAVLGRATTTRPTRDRVSSSEGTWSPSPSLTELATMMKSSN